LSMKICGHELKEHFPMFNDLDKIYHLKMANTHYNGIKSISGTDGGRNFFMQFNKTNFKYYPTNSEVDPNLPQFCDMNRIVLKITKDIQMHVNENNFDTLISTYLYSMEKKGIQLKSKKPTDFCLTSVVNAKFLGFLTNSLLEKAGKKTSKKNEGAGVGNFGGEKYNVGPVNFSDHVYFHFKMMSLVRGAEKGNNKDEMPKITMYTYKTVKKLISEQFVFRSETEVWVSPFVEEDIKIMDDDKDIFVPNPGSKRVEAFEDGREYRQVKEGDSSFSIRNNEISTNLFTNNSNNPVNNFPQNNINNNTNSSNISRPTFFNPLQKHKIADKDTLENPFK
jgi:hypothetical protein